MKLRRSDHARRDLLAIGRYIARDKPQAARGWIEQLRERARQAAENPFAGRVVPELGRDDVREVFLRSYRIVYSTYLYIVTIRRNNPVARDLLVLCGGSDPSLDRSN